ncbi:MAG: hypothetical protein AB7S75_00420 [Desulfococcaceae bacterium]
MKGHGQVGLWSLLPILCGAGAFGGAIGAAKSLKLENIHFLITLFEGLTVGAIYAWIIKTCGGIVLRRMLPHLQSECRKLQRKANFAVGAVLVIGFICFFIAGPVGMGITILFIRLFIQ